MMRYRLPFLLLLFIFVPTQSIVASDDIYSDHAMEIQAAFLVKFSAYVKWPEKTFSSSKDPIIIGIVGRDPFGSNVDKIARSFKAKGRNIVIRRFTNTTSLTKSHILFVPFTEQKNMEEIRSACSGNAVLLIGHFPGFIEQSGIINFVMVGNKIRFNISRTNYQKVGFTISSKLLSVAHEIK